jgi:hypothetical protein
MNARISNRVDRRGRPLDFEAGQIHVQIDILDGGTSHSRKQREDNSLWAQLDRLADFYDSSGKPSAILYVTAEQEETICIRMRRKKGEPLEHRQHPVRIASV